MGADEISWAVLKSVELDGVKRDGVQRDYVQRDYVQRDYVQRDYVKLDYVESGGGCWDRRRSIFSARVARFSRARILPARPGSSVRATRSCARSSAADPAA